MFILFHTGSTGYEATVVGFDGSIERFKQILPPIERPNPLSADTAHYLLVIHCLCQSATIQLHRGFAARSSTSMTKCLTAANSIIRTVQAVGVQSIQFVNPIIGVSFGFRSVRPGMAYFSSGSVEYGKRSSHTWFTVIEELSIRLGLVVCFTRRR